VTAGEALPSRWPLELVRGYVDKVLEVAASIPGGTVPIQPAGHPSLRTRALPYDGQLDDDVLAALLEVMRRTMHAAPGVGLAAPQIGLPLALAVLADPGAADPETAAVRERPELPYRVLVNPAYEAVPGSRRSCRGCAASGSPARTRPARRWTRSCRAGRRASSSTRPTT
jgi:peptide deformylase